MKKLGVFTVKGGAGKSTIAKAVAEELRPHVRKVGLLDADVVKPDLFEMLLGVTPAKAWADLTVDADGIRPLNLFNMEFFSLGFYPESERATMLQDKTAAEIVAELFTSVKWTCDVLVVDMPPQSHDASRTIVDLFRWRDAFLVVTTPREAPILDAKRTIDLLETMHKRVLGIVVNMAYRDCPNCGFREGWQRPSNFDLLRGHKVIAEIPWVNDGEEVGQYIETGSLRGGLTTWAALRDWVHA